jgi:hypothetical protein
MKSLVKMPIKNYIKDNLERKEAYQREENYLLDYVISEENDITDKVDPQNIEADIDKLSDEQNA